MSFAGDTKNSLCSALYGRAGKGKGQKGQSRSQCCSRSMLYGMLLFSTQAPPRPLRMITENEATAKQLLTLLSHCLDVQGTLTARERQTGGESDRPRSYKVTAEGEEAARTLAAFCGGEQESAERISKAYFVCPDCLRSFARGAFLAAGTVADPKISYHLDITAADPALAQEFCYLLSGAGIPAKHTHRKKSNIIYFKESEAIEDFLTFIGAQQAALSMMDVSIYREIRNQENRRSNCDTANISKTVDSSAKQLRAIRRLKESGRFWRMDGELQKTALLREQHPEDSLQELADAHTPPITKSGVNHRLKKIVELGDE